MRTVSFKDNGMMAEGFSVRSKGFLTTAYKVQGLDLLIKQTNPQGEDTYLQHYSNPGINFFTVLLKFLYLNERRIPKLLELKDPVHDEFRIGARGIGTIIAVERFPISYSYHFQSSVSGKYPVAELRSALDESGSPELHVALEHGTIIISPSAAHSMALKIPQMYPGLESFHIAYNEFLGEAKNHPEQIIKTPSQLKLEFMKKLRRSTSPASPKT